MSNLMVGAGKAEICLSEIMFPNRENFVRILDPLYVRVVLISAESRVALVSLELTSMMGGIDDLRLKVGQLTGTDPDHVWITVTHTFSAPHLSVPSTSDPGGPGGPGGPQMSPEEKEQEKKTGKALLSAIESAAQQAVESLRKASMGLGIGTCGVNAGRDIETNEGWWLGEGSTAYADKDLNVVSFNDEEENLIAAVYNYAVQSSVLDHAEMPGGGYLVSGDICGTASRHVETAYPESVALFLCGAAGDQAPRKKASTSVVSDDGSIVPVERGLDGIAVKDELGQEFGEAVCRTIAAAKVSEEAPVIRAESRSFSAPAKVMPDRSQVKPGKNPVFTPDGYKETSFEVLQVGPVAFVGVKPELSAIIGAQIREKSPFQLTLTATMVNGGAKYMADELAFHRNTYAAQNGYFALGAAELLREHVIALLKEMAGQA